MPCPDTRLDYFHQFSGWILKVCQKLVTPDQDLVTPRPLARLDYMLRQLFPGIPGPPWRGNKDR